MGIRVLSLAGEVPAEVDDFVLKHHKNGKDLHIPNLVYTELYSYQKDAIDWLWSLHCRKIGGLLADDMGLGKTRMVNFMQ